MKRTQLAFVLTALCVAPLTSCIAVAAAGAGAGIGYVFYQRNEVHQDFPVDLETAWEAVLDVAGANEEGTNITSWMKDGAAELDGPDLKIRAEVRIDGITRIKIRIGTFETDEHERQAELMLEEIAQKLGVEPIEDEDSEKNDAEHDE